MGVLMVMMSCYIYTDYIGLSLSIHGHIRACVKFAEVVRNSAYSFRNPSTGIGFIVSRSFDTHMHFVGARTGTRRVAINKS